MNQGKIDGVRMKKQKLLDTSKKMLRNSQECGKKYQNLTNEVKKALKAGNQEGAMIYCVSAIRQKKFEKRCLIYSNRLEALAYNVEDAIVHHEATVGYSVTASALEAITGLNTADQLDETVENLKQSTDQLAEAERRMTDFFDENETFSTSTTEDSQLARDLFNMLSQEHRLNEVESHVPEAPGNFNITCVPNYEIEGESISTQTIFSSNLNNFPL